MSRLADGPTVWNLLNGIVCLYKPINESAHRVRRSFLTKLCAELNTLEPRPPKLISAVQENAIGERRLIVRPSYADHPLVVGPRYQTDDFSCTWSTYLGINTSGVFGLNKGTNQANKIHQFHPMRTYHVKGCLGFVTNNLFRTGKVLKEKNFKHVRKATLEKHLETVQALHQRQMFEMAGVDLQSQEAYDLAVKGLIRPVNSDAPVIYGTRLIDFNPPDFTIEVHCINEYEAYLMALILALGQKLHTLATCMGIHCIKHSFFTLDDALLKKHWTLENVISNLANSRRLVRNQGNLGSHLTASKKMYHVEV